MEIITTSDQETFGLGKNIVEQFRGGDIVLLKGELGSGKTTLTKGILSGLSVNSQITSPTFSLMNVYLVKSKKINSVVHIDTYRLKNEQELVDIGVEDYLGDPNTLCVIEWPEKIGDLLQNKRTTLITIEHLEENKRKITIQ